MTLDNDYAGVDTLDMETTERTETRCIVIYANIYGGYARRIFWTENADELVERIGRQIEGSGWYVYDTEPMAGRRTVTS